MRISENVKAGVVVVGVFPDVFDLPDFGGELITAFEKGAEGGVGVLGGWSHWLKMLKVFQSFLADSVVKSCYCYAVFVGSGEKAAGAGSVGKWENTISHSGTTHARSRCLDTI